MRAYAFGHTLRAVSPTTTLLQRLCATGLTQTEIARHTRIPQYRLSRWLSRGAPVGADDALRLADYAKQVLPAEGAGSPTKP